VDCILFLGSCTVHEANANVPFLGASKLIIIILIFSRTTLPLSNSLSFLSFGILLAALGRVGKAEAQESDKNRPRILGSLGGGGGGGGEAMGQQSSKESESSVVGSTVRAVSGATGAAAGAVKDTAGQLSQILILCIYHCKNE
jgi:hypothetical protein